MITDKQKWYILKFVNFGLLILLILLLLLIVFKNFSINVLTPILVVWIFFDIVFIISDRAFRLRSPGGFILEVDKAAESFKKELEEINYSEINDIDTEEIRRRFLSARSIEDITRISSQVMYELVKKSIADRENFSEEKKEKLLSTKSLSPSLDIIFEEK